MPTSNSKYDFIIKEVFEKYPYLLEYPFRKEIKLNIIKGYKKGYKKGMEKEKIKRIQKAISR
ncbi:MAG: hypothetical protein COZ18_07130 [Flexibacter sp. CG_4_10_14_3_um_filter_32_15]|nr:MAG: hypothetical protein COZ18_07130 [Flexibacter sp. CG_4_10_14_3_um_filter_32_15]